MSKVQRQVGASLSRLISATHQAEPDCLWDVGMDAFGVLTGHFSADGAVYAFTMKDDTGICLTPTDRYDAYVAGLAQNANTMRADRQVRQVQCGPNTKRCGGRCIPKEQTCHIGLSEQQQQQAKETRQTVKQAQRSGNWRNVALIGGAIAGLAAVGAGAAILSQQAAHSQAHSQRPSSPNSSPSFPLSPTLGGKAPSSLLPHPSFLIPPSSSPLSPAQSPSLADLVRQSILVSNPGAGVTARTRLPRTVSPVSVESEVVSPSSTRSLSGTVAVGALPAAAPRLTNQTQPTTNPALIPPPTQGVVIAGAGSTLPAKAARQPKAKKPTVEGQTPVAVVPKKTAKPKTPAKAEVEQQTDRLAYKHRSFDTKATAIAASQAKPSVVAALTEKINAIDVAHRQLLNPLQPDYFAHAPNTIRETATQLGQVSRATASLERKLLAGKTLVERQQQAVGALSGVDEHLQRLGATHAFVSSRKRSAVRDRQLERLDQQREQMQSLREKVLTTAKSLDALADQKARLASLQERLSTLPTKQSQLDMTTLVQYRQAEKVRRLQGSLPAKLTQFVEASAEQGKAIATQQTQLDQFTSTYAQQRGFAQQSMSVFIERQQKQLHQDVQALRLMSGDAGLRWVTSMTDDNIPQGLALTVKQAQKATGVGKIDTVEQAALFRDHVQRQLAARIEGTAQAIEQRMQYPREVSQQALEQANVQLADLSEIQKQVVVGGQVKVKQLTKDLQKTARESAIALQGDTLLQPYRQAHEATVQQVQAIQAEQTQAAGALLADGQSVRDRIVRDLGEPIIYDLHGLAKSTEQLQTELTAIREESRTLRKLQQVAALATPLAETQSAQVVRQKQNQQSQHARRQITTLQKQRGQLQLEIKRRQAAAKRGQSKGVQTGALEAQSAALQKQINSIAQRFFGTEKHDAIAS